MSRQHPSQQDHGPFYASDATLSVTTNREEPLIEASAGGPATVDINYDEHECGVGESFTVESTTFTCTEIGDESIVLDLVRG